MGMSEPGEIDRLAEIAAPEVGVITNAFRAHLASMGSVEAVAKAKGELFLRLPENGTAVYNADDPLVSACPVAAGVKRLSFGLQKADVMAMDIKGLGLAGQSFILHMPEIRLPVTLRAYGQHNIYNALAASAAAIALGVAPELIKDGLEAFTPYDKRFHLEEVNGVVLIDDSYNANPASMAAALVTLRDLRQQNRSIAVLGDMLELGDDSAGFHRSVGELAAFCADRLYLIGAMSELVASVAKTAGLDEREIVRANSHEEIIDDLRRNLKPGDFVLVKGSRGMRMDIVATAIRRGFKDEEGDA
jgi:UDP-N-acetylmuramoyl-tripeptide--D-alanyl-D-alanine ligase